jgi:DNA-binding IclR family transcriptional regulator
MTPRPNPSDARADRQPDGQPDGAAPKGVQAVDRALTLLAGVADASPRGATTAELAERCGLNKATVWRLLGTLEAHGLVQREPGTGRYAVGHAVIRMSAAAGYDGLVRRCHPVLERVSAETGETADLAVTGPHGVTYVGEVAPASVLAVNWLAREVPLHATSTGLAYLAWLPEAEARGLLERPLRRFTAATVTDPDRVMEVLRQTRRRGYAACAGEVEPTLYGVSAPVLDPRTGHPAAVFSIWGPMDRVPATRLPSLGPVAVSAAEEIAGILAS